MRAFKPSLDHVSINCLKFQQSQLLVLSRTVTYKRKISEVREEGEGGRPGGHLALYI